MVVIFPPIALPVLGRQTRNGTKSNRINIFCAEMTETMYLLTSHEEIFKLFDKNMWIFTESPDLKETIKSKLNCLHREGWIGANYYYWKFFGKCLDTYKNLVFNGRKKVNRIEKCCVCLEKVSNVITECDHQFCKNCLSMWIEKRDNCPICRKEYFKIYKI